jgi:hypothetical protein
MTWRAKSARPCTKDATHGVVKPTLARASTAPTARGAPLVEEAFTTLEAPRTKELPAPRTTATTTATSSTPAASGAAGASYASVVAKRVKLLAVFLFILIHTRARRRRCAEPPTATGGLRRGRTRSASRHRNLRRPLAPAAARSNQTHPHIPALTCPTTNPDAAHAAFCSGL